jgi:hypothetical protein
MTEPTPTVRFVSLFVERLGPSLKDLIAGALLAAITTAIQLSRGKLTVANFRDYTFETFLPYIGIILLYILVHLAQTAFSLIKTADTDFSGRSQVIVTDGEFGNIPHWYKAQIIGLAAFFILCISGLYYWGWKSVHPTLRPIVTFSVSFEKATTIKVFLGEPIKPRANLFDLRDDENRIPFIFGFRNDGPFTVTKMTFSYEVAALPPVEEEHMFGLFKTMEENDPQKSTLPDIAVNDAPIVKIASPVLSKKDRQLLKAGTKYLYVFVIYRWEDDAGTSRAEACYYPEPPGDTGHWVTCRRERHNFAEIVKRKSAPLSQVAP